MPTANGVAAALDVVLEEPLDPELRPHQRPVVAAAAVQGHDDRQGRRGAEGRDDREAGLEPAAALGDERALLDVGGLDVGHRARLAVQPEGVLELWPTGQHALVDAGARPDDAHGRHADGPQQQGAAGGHAAQCRSWVVACG